MYIISPSLFQHSVRHPRPRTELVRSEARGVYVYVYMHRYMHIYIYGTSAGESLLGLFPVDGVLCRRVGKCAPECGPNNPRWRARVAETCGAYPHFTCIFLPLKSEDI